MAIQNLFTSRDNNLDGNTYVGQLGRLWYNPDTNSLYASDGVTVGGIPVDLATNANILANTLTVNTVTSTSGNVNITGNLVISGNISPAAVGKIGGISPGPGVVISNQGELTIDTSGLPLSFGNFTANNNILTIINAGEDMILATSGNAEIQLVGNIGFYKSNGLPPDPARRYFFASDDGQLTILVPAEDPIAGGVEIIGSSTGTFVDPGAPGTMLHITGNPDISCRVYQDSLRSYSSLVARRYNGNTASPGQVLAGEDVFRINATAATDAGMGNVAMAQIRFTALENQTTTAQGSEIGFFVTPIGEPAANRVEVLSLTAANGVTATQFTTTGNITAGNLTLTTGGIISSSGLISTTSNISAGNISVTGNVTANTFVGNLTGTANTATNLAAATGILTGSISIDPASVLGTTSSTQTFTLTGLTTSHKLVITAGTALNAGLIIQAAWASAVDTISIEFYNTTNQPIDAGATTIQYFAWV